MSLRLIFLILFSVALAFGTKAQTTRDVNSTAPPSPAYQAQKKTQFKIFNHKKDTKDDEEVAEFRERMKKVQKRKRKEAKLAEKPQYSDPLYFGHKKPPKKRPNGRKKFCKECGLVH